MMTMKKTKQPLSYEQKYLMTEIMQTKDALAAAYSSFNNAVDPDMIDCCIYQVNSVQKRYKFLLQRAREAEIDVK